MPLYFLDSDAYSEPYPTYNIEHFGKTIPGYLRRYLFVKSQQWKDE